ncbi:MAG: hypothetical protein GX974_10570 [Clostridiales bacterium]|nr:hypothetical protein [Clostridiales bacterium]
MSKDDRKTKNLPAKIVSVIFAIILWFVAIGEQNPEIVRSYSDIPVRVQNESQLSRNNLSLVYDIEEPITIRLKGRSKDLNRIETDDIKGYIDLSDIDKPGEQKVDIEVEGLPLGVRLEKQPERMVVVDKITSKEVPVEAEIIGKEASGYLMQPYTLKPNNIRVTGPEVMVNKVVKGRVSLDVKDSKSTIEQSLPINLLDENGQAIESKFLSMYQDFAIVTVPIYPKKSVSIEAAISGKPASGYEVTDIEIQPKDIVVSGSEALLDDMKSISTELIDLEGAKTDIKRTVKLQKYEGMYLDPSQPSEVSIVIRIRPIEVEEDLSDVKIDVKNLGLNRLAELSTDSVDLVLKGDKPTIDAMKEDEIKVYVDLGRASRGEKKFPLNVNVPEGVEVLSIEPQEVTINIK